MRFLILGDTHNYFEHAVPKLEDALKVFNYNAIIQVGDLAYLPKVWGDWNRGKNKLITDFVDNNNLKFYWIDGNHEDHSVLQYVIDFNTSIHNVYGSNFIYQPRGSYVELDKFVLFFIGGAETRDKHMRTEGVDYFPEELIFLHQQDYIIDQIEIIKSLKKEIIVISHTVPAMVIKDDRNILDLHTDSVNVQNKTLDIVLQSLNPIQWYHGHFHRERVYTMHGFKTTFFSLGAFLTKDNVDDRKFLIVEL